MSKKFEEAYKEYLNSQAPDLWGRINDRLDAKQQDCLGRTADDNVVKLRRQKHRRCDRSLCGGSHFGSSGSAYSQRRFR